jgi:PAS domain S-box-containing protein
MAVFNKKYLVLNEKILIDFINNIPRFISVTDIDTGKFFAVNDYAEKVLGYSRAQLLGRTALELELWVDLADRQRTIEHVKKYGVLENREARFRKADGSIIYGIYSVTQRDSYLIFDLHDITAYHLRIDNFHTGILSVNSDNRIIFANQAARDFFGRDELIDLDIRKLMNNFMDKINLFSGRDTNSANPHYFEAVLLDRYGSKRLCSISVSWHKDKDGQGQITLHFIDKTLQLKTEFELVNTLSDLKIALDDAQKADQAKNDFLANMSHELRNPINAIELAINLAKDALTVDPDKALSYLQMAETKAANLREISTNVLDYFKIEQNIIEIKSEKFSLADLLNEFRSYELTAQANGLDFEIISDPVIPTELLGDVQKLRQVLINLLNNAFKFTAAGQVRLIITAEERISDKIILKFQVIDTGPGIDSVDLKKLFNSFTQLDSSYTKKYQGSGLGLSIVKKLLKALGAEIEVEVIFILCLSLVYHMRIGSKKLLSRF